MHPSELELVGTFIQSHPDAAAREVELQPLDMAVELMKAIPLPQGRQIVRHMLPSYAARLCDRLSLDLVAGLLDDFSANQVATILRCLPGEKYDDLLAVLPQKKAALCRLLMSYSEDVVGAWMLADIVMLPLNCTVAESLNRFTTSNGLISDDGLPVVDDNTYLIGQVYLRDLLRAKPEAPITPLIRPPLPVLLSRTSILSAAAHSGWKSHDTLMVNNRNKQLIGLLRHSELRRSLESFDNQSGIALRDDLLGGMLEMYGSSLIALLGLAEEQKGSRVVIGERR